VPREDGVPVREAAAQLGEPEGLRETGEARERPRRIEQLAGAAQRAHLLQARHVGARLLDHLRDALGVAAAVAAAHAVDVPRHDP
jgi:hypothetical protein